MVANPVAVRPQTDGAEVTEMVQRYHLLAVPAVDHGGWLLGLVTIDDVIGEMQEEATEDIATMVGAGRGETIYTPVAHSVRSRLHWTAVNLGTALLVAAVVSQFEPMSAAWPCSPPTCRWWPRWDATAGRRARRW